MMAAENWRNIISGLLGKPQFNGERIWVWKSEECEFSYCLNFNGGFAVFIHLTDENKFFDFYYNNFKDVEKSAKYYSRYFTKRSNLMGIEVKESEIYLVNAGVNEDNLRNRKVCVQMQFEIDVVEQALQESKDTNSDIVYLPLPEQKFGSGAITIGFKQSTVLYAHITAVRQVRQFVHLFLEPPPYTETPTLV